jgi:PAS domain S-box-containing protein
MRVPLDRQVTVAFALALALLIALSAVSYRGIGTLVQALKAGQQAPETIEATAFMSLSVIIVTGLASALLLYLARLVIVRELRRRLRAERALQRINADLEGIVAERTDDLTRANSRLRKSETLVLESRAQLSEIIGSAMDAIVNVDQDGNVVLFNAAAERMFGCPAADAVGQPIDRFIPDLKGKALDRDEAIDDAGSRDTRPGVVMVRRADGSQLSAEASVSEIELDGRKHCTIILRDITERQQIEAERERLLARAQEARQQAEEANRLKDEFVATISHELRAPLNAILGWTRLLHTGKLDPATSSKAVETIERSALSQSRLIDDLLDISRIVTGKLRIDVRTVDPNAAIRSAVEAVGPAASAKSIALDVRLDPAVGVIAGDPNRFQQIIWNLLSNAIKFTPNGGSVRVTSGRQNSKVVVSVADTGQGISPEFLPHVFDRFRQGDSSSSRKHGGLGLGLAIVQHLAEMHDGTVSEWARPLR